MTPQQARDQQSRQRCAEVIMDYGQAHPDFLQGVIEGYVASLPKPDVAKLLDLLMSKPEPVSRLWGRVGVEGGG